MAVYLDDFLRMWFITGCPAAYNGETVEDNSFLFNLQLH